MIRLTNTSPDTTPFGIDVCGVALLLELNVVALPTTAGAAPPAGVFGELGSAAIVKDC